MAHSRGAGVSRGTLGGASLQSFCAFSAFWGLRSAAGSKIGCVAVLGLWSHTREGGREHCQGLCRCDILVAVLYQM